MTTHSPAPGTRQTGTKGWAGGLVFIVSNLILRALAPEFPDIASDPMWTEALTAVVSGALGGATAYLVPNKAK